MLSDELRRIDLLSEISDDCRAVLLDGARFQNYPRHATIFEEGDKSEFLHILVEGEVELFARFNEQETTIAVVHPHCTFNLSAAIDYVPCLTSARAPKASRLLAISAAAVRRAFDQDKAFARAVARELSRGFRDVMVQLKGQKLLTCTERLADWLLCTDAQYGGSGRFTLPFDKRILASHLGMTPENLSRSLKFLSRHGAQVQGRDVVLNDPAALAAVAHIAAPPLRGPDAAARVNRVRATG